MKIYQDQIMLAARMGADIERVETTKPWSTNWVKDTQPKNIVWNWHNWNFRIANKTADGMRLDELVEKYPEEVGVLCHGGTYKKNNTVSLVKEMCEHPEYISKLQIKQEKKLRPWTMEEFEKNHYDKFFIAKSDTSRTRTIVTSFNEEGVFFAAIGGFSFVELLEQYETLNGEPCGVEE